MLGNHVEQRAAPLASLSALGVKAFRRARVPSAGAVRQRARARTPFGMFSIGDLLLSALLMVNGAAVLNEDRFLTKVGWGYEQSRQEPQSVKKQIINLLHAVRLLFTLPLMALNIVVIALKLVLG